MRYEVFYSFDHQVVVVVVVIVVIIIIIILHGLGQWPVPVQSLTSELMNLFGHLVGWGISPMQGLYLHRTT
jgi:hypothetical protein